MDTLQEDPAGETNDQLFAQVRAGLDAVGPLLQSYRGYLFKIAHEELDDALQARVGESDVVGAACLKVFAYLDRATAGLVRARSQVEFKGWLREMLINEIHDTHRAHAGPARDYQLTAHLPSGSGPVGPTSTPSTVVAARERDDSVSAAMAAQPEADRLLYRLSVLHGWSSLELAALLTGVRSDAARRAMDRRLYKIRLQLAGHQGLADQTPSA